MIFEPWILIYTFDYLIELNQIIDEISVNHHQYISLRNAHVITPLLGLGLEMTLMPSSEQ